MMSSTLSAVLGLFRGASRERARGAPTATKQCEHSASNHPAVRTADSQANVLTSMRVILVGPSKRRARLRSLLPEQFELLGEAESLSEARRVQDVDAYLVAAAPPQDGDAPPIEPLTSREIEVVSALADGLSNKAIAARLGISDETVKFHLSAIFGKLQASNRTDAVRQALRSGIVEL